MSFIKDAQSKVFKSGFLSDKIVELLNFRIQREEFSSRKYVAMHLWLEDKGHFNSSALWKKFSEEELKHADWAREHLLSFNLRPHTRPLEQVPEDYKSLADIIRKTVEHETEVTKECQDLAKACMDEGNVLTYTLAFKYVSEQVEEMRKSYDLLNLLEVYGEDQLNLALLDHEIERFLE